MAHGSALEKDSFNNHDASSTEAMLQEAVDYLAGVFEEDEPIDGADLVEWFSQWRGRAKRALENRR